MEIISVALLTEWITKLTEIIANMGATNAQMLPFSVSIQQLLRIEKITYSGIATELYTYNSSCPYWSWAIPAPVATIGIGMPIYNYVYAYIYTYICMYWKYVRCV